MDERWEYFLGEIHGPGANPALAINAELNRLGEEGWELIQVIAPTYYFKREKH
jgi:hypothetical protein